MTPTGDIFGQPPGRMSSIRGKLADHLGDHVVLSPEGTVLATSTGTESLYPHPPQSLNNSCHSPHPGSIGPTQDHHIVSPNYQTGREDGPVKYN